MTLVSAKLRAVDEADRDQIRRLIEPDPVGQCVFEARLGVARTLHSWDLGGQIWGLAGPSGLRAACFAGGNLIPLAGDRQDMQRLGGALAEQRRTWSSVVGHAEAALPLWEAVGTRWGQARIVRECQPLLATHTVPSVAADPLVRRVRPREVGRYLPAAVDMFTEELELNPPATGTNSPYRRRLVDLIASGFAFARFSDDGRVVFKAEIAAVSARCCHVQGVWVDPDLRGQGIGRAGMAAVIRYGLELAPIVSLYVNDFNHPARALYARLGMRQVGTFATVLF